MSMTDALSHAAERAGGDGAEPVKTPPRSMDEIESDLQSARDRLADRIDALQDYVTPSNLVKRQVDKVTGIFVDEFGGIRPERVAMAVGAVVALLVISGAFRRRRD